MKLFKLLNRDNGQEPEEKSTESVDIVLANLDYFEILNLLTMIYKANNPKWSESQSYSEAVNTITDDDKTRYKIEELLKTGLHSGMRDL